jgi:hypothetical protein
MLLTMREVEALFAWLGCKILHLILRRREAPSRRIAAGKGLYGSRRIALTHDAPHHEEKLGLFEN